MSFEAIREELSYVQASVVKDNKTEMKFLLPSKITQRQEAIYKALKINLSSKVRVLSQQ